MTIIELIYACFFVLTLFSALMVVASSHTVHSALYLVLTMISMSAMFIMINAQLAAMFQVIVYAGAIMVLFLFVIMLLNLGRQSVSPIRTRRVRQFGLLFAAAFAIQIVVVMASRVERVAVSPKAFIGLKIGEVARLLITQYLYAFEATSALLLIGVVGSIILARRRPVTEASRWNG